MLRRSPLLLCLLASCFTGTVLPAQMRDVSRTYTEFCASCHGPRLQGGSAQSLLDDTWVTAGDDETLRRVIREGMPERGMPPFGAALSEPEIRALVVYIREQRADYQRNRDTRPTPTADKVFRTEDEAFRMEVVTDEVHTPWGMAWLPDGRMLITEKAGDLRLISADGTLHPRPIAGTPEVDTGSQAGLLDVAPHPDYAKNGWIYLAFSHPARQANGRSVSMTKVVRGRLDDHRWVDEETIYEAPRELYRPIGGVHFGSRLAFDGKGHVFFPIGDRGAQQQAQDLSRPNGKIHRLRDDGSVPADNPFVDRPNALPSIWTYGNSNPQGLDFDPTTGRLWAAEHGPRGGDELNWIRPGLNYGWPEVTYGMNYDGTPITAVTTRPDVAPPVIHWTPSIAVSGIDFYEGDKFPAWRGNLLVGALAQQHVRRVVIEDGEVTKQEVILADLGRVRDVASGPDGYIYVALNQPDMIVRLVPAK